MLESCFNNVACLKRLHHKYFLLIFVKFLITPIFESLVKIKKRFSVKKLAKQRNGDSRTCVHWYFTKHFSELRYLFSQSPKVVFKTNCAFPLMPRFLSFTHLFCFLILFLVELVWFSVGLVS